MLARSESAHKPPMEHSAQLVDPRPPAAAAFLPPRSVIGAHLIDPEPHHQRLPALLPFRDPTPE
jgi:hypothetical protein